MRNQIKAAVQVASVLVCIALAHGVCLSQPTAGTVKTDSLKRIDHPPVIVTARIGSEDESLPLLVTREERVTPSTGLTLSEALNTAGVQIDRRNNFAVGERISMRGLGARSQFGARGVRLILDDVPVTFADGQSGTEWIDPSEIERIEVIHGPSSAQYGNASGGVIAARSRPIGPERFQTTVATLAGSDGLRRNDAMLSGRIATIEAQGKISRLDYTGWREHADAHLDRSSAKVLVPVSENSLLTITAGTLALSARNPGALTDSQMRVDPRQSDISNYNYGTGKDLHQQQASARWLFANGAQRLDLSAYGIHRDVLNPIVQRVIDLERDAGGLRAEFGDDIASLNHLRYTLGVDIDAQSDARRNFVNTAGTSGKLTLDQQERVLGIGGFVEALAPLSNTLHLLGALRYDRTNFSVTDRFWDPAVDTIDDSGRRTMDGLSPSIGLTWRAIDEITFYTNLSTAFETPTTTELANQPSEAGGFNPELSPQRNSSVELGIKGSIGESVIGGSFANEQEVRRPLRYQLAFYDMRVRDELIAYGVPAFTGRSYYRNAGSATHRGAEATIDYAPVESIMLHLSANLLDARFTDFHPSGKSYDRNIVPGASPLDIAASIAATLPYGFRIEPRFRYGGRVMVDDANSAGADPYSVLDLRFAHDGLALTLGTWQATLTLDAGINNLTNARYTSYVAVNAFGRRFFEPGSGRAFFTSASLRVGLN